MCQPLQYLLCQMAVGLNRQMDFQQHWCLHQQLQLHPKAFDAPSGERSTKTTEIMQTLHTPKEYHKAENKKKEVGPYQKRTWVSKDLSNWRDN